MSEIEPDGLESTGKPKKKDKDRHVWISFFGRIVAQVVGAIASVVLGIFVLTKYQDRQQASDPAPVAAAMIQAPVARTHGQHAIAVLPLDNFSANPDDAYFADGMTEVLIADLAQLEGWRVISRTSAETYRDSKKPLTQIARELSVDLVVEGSVTKVGDRVRVTVQLIDADLDQHLFARSYDRTTEDLLELQSTLALEIAKSLKAAITPTQERRLAKRETVDPAVYDLYLRGRHSWNQRTPESLAAAINYFSEAVKLDPTFALAHVGLADAHSIAGSLFRGGADAQAQMSRARSAAEQALRLDDQLAEAHTALGGVQFFGDRDAVAAEQSFKRAIALNSNYPVAHEWYAVLLSERGRDTEARQHADTAVSLDPGDATMHQARGIVDYYAHRYTDAAVAERKALEMRPQLPFARIVLVKALIMKGDQAAAVSSCDSFNALASDQTDLVLACGIALHRSSDARAAAALARLQAITPLPEPAIAQWHAATGDLGRAFALLIKLHASGNLPPNLAFDPLFEALRADPRYAPLKTTH
jgi:TolB-like protein/Tfp pilus assembly protein PilF